MKKSYVKPAMRVIKIQQSQMLCSSPDYSAKSVHSSDGFSMPSGGTLDGDDM